MRRAQFGGAIGSTGHPCQFLGQNVVKDEVPAGIGGHQRKPVVRQKLPHVCSGGVQQISVEQLNPLIARRRDIGEGAVHRAEGAIAELGDRGDAHGIAAKRPPAIGVIRQFPRSHW